MRPPGLQSVDSVVPGRVAPKDGIAVWTTSSWLASTRGVTDAIARALTSGRTDGGPELEFVRGLGPVVGVLGFSQGGAMAAQVADEVGVVARDVLAAKRLQHELCNVSNRTFHKIVDRLIADPRTTVAAIDFLVKVLEQPGAVDASRDLMLGVVNDTKTADTMGELFVRVGGKEGTKDAVVTVFTNCFADADAHKQGVDWLRRVVTSEPVVGTCGGEAHEQVSRALGSQKVWASSTYT